MEEQKFKIGDVVVRLKSDSADNIPMTVNGYLKDESQYKEALIHGSLSESDLRTVRCVWRDNENKPHEKYYHEDSLSIVK